MPEPVVTQENDGAAQTGAEGSATTPAANGGTGSGDRVALLESRVIGLEARLAESGRGRSSMEKERNEATQRLADYEAGKLKDNEAFQAELKRERDRATAAEQAARLAAIEARYPETFSVLGAAAAGLADEVLAASEARFQGAPAQSEPPTPRNPSTTRPPAAKLGEERSGEKKTFSQLAAEFKTVRLPWSNDD